jgi:hypothetical protein
MCRSKSDMVQYVVQYRTALYDMTEVQCLWISDLMRLLVHFLHDVSNYRRVFVVINDETGEKSTCLVFASLVVFCALRLVSCLCWAVPCSTALYCTVLSSRTTLLYSPSFLYLHVLFTSSLFSSCIFSQLVIFASLDPKKTTTKINNTRKFINNPCWKLRRTKRQAWPPRVSANHVLWWLTMKMTSWTLSAWIDYLSWEGRRFLRSKNHHCPQPTRR